MDNNFVKFIAFIVAGLTAIVYGVKVWDDLSHPEYDSEGNLKPNKKPKSSIIRNVIYSGFGSGLVCLLVCEGLLYYTELPFTLTLLLGALCGFTGADSFKDVLLRFVENKLNSATPSQRDNK